MTELEQLQETVRMLTNERAQLIKKADAGWSAVDRLVNGLTTKRRAYKKDGGYKNTKPGHYPFIPLGSHRLWTALCSLEEQGHININNALSFLDAGCGIGNQVLTAYQTHFFTLCAGIEINETLVNQAKRVLFDNSIEKANILTYKYYNRYDVIYYYCPLNDGRKQSKFEERLENEMKVGAIVMAFLKMSHKIQKDSRFERITNIKYAESVFRKISD